MKLERILFRCIYGSTLYGTNLPSSDKDYKAIYLPKLTELLIGHAPQTVRESTAVHGMKHGADDVEVEYIPIQTWLRDVHKGQTYALELLFAYGNPKVEQSTSDVALMNKVVGETKSMWLSDNVKPLVGYALNMAKQYGIRGERLSSLQQLRDEIGAVRSSCLWSSNVEDMNSLRVRELRGTVTENKYIFWKDSKIGEKIVPSLVVMEKVYYETIPLNELFQVVDKLIEKYGHRVKQAQADGQVDWKATYHALRVMYEANEFLSTQKITIPLKPLVCEVLMKIRQGLYELDYVRDLMEQQLDNLDINAAETSLTPWTDERQNQFNNWLEQWMLKFYKL